MRMLDTVLAHPVVKRDLLSLTKDAIDDPLTVGTISLPSAIAFDIQNVANYFSQQYPSGNPDPDFHRTIPSWVPPFSSIWMECNILGQQFGGHCQTVDLWEILGEDDSGTYAQEALDQVMEHQAWNRQIIRDPVRWVSYWWVSMLKDNGDIAGPLCEHRVFLDPSGYPARIEGPEEKLAMALAFTDAINPPPTDEEARPIFRSLMHAMMPMFLAVGFMHCKNVQVEIAPMPPAPVRKKREKKVKHPLVEFKTLIIEPMKKVLATEGRADEVGLQRALHICRGHFVTYSEDKPLFGKVTGTFWKSAHVRGSAKQGAVIKDYRVKSA